MSFKRSLLPLLLLSLFWTTAFSQAYKIKVSVKGVRDSLCYLAVYYGNNEYPLKDTAKADPNGNIVFEGNRPLTGGIYVVILPGKKFFEIIIDKEQNFTVETDTADFIRHTKFKGSPESSMYYDYIRFIAKKHREAGPLKKALEEEQNKDGDKYEEIRQKLVQLDNEVSNYWNLILREHPNSFMAKVFIKPMMEIEIPPAPKLPDGRTDSLFAWKYYIRHYFDNIDFSDERILHTPHYHSKLDHYFKNVVIQQPDSVIAAADFVLLKAKADKELFKYTLWYISKTYQSSKIMGMDAVIVHLVEKYYTIPVASWLDSAGFYRVTSMVRSMKPLLIGKKAPALILEDTLGKYHSLYSLKAKYTVLVFWDPDCGLCQKEIPKLGSLYDSIKALDGEVMAAMGTPEADKWKKFIREHNLKWINVGDPHYRSSFREMYDLKSYPQLYILDENKVIIAKKLEAEQVIDFLRRYGQFDKRKNPGSK
jgi:peroxiredoxin